MGPGKRRSGLGSSTRTWRTWRVTRPASWPPIAATGPIASRRPRGGGPFPGVEAEPSSPATRADRLHPADRRAGGVELLNRRSEVDSRWLHRPVRAEVDLDGGVVGFYRLRRREPADQPLLKQVTYRLPERRFRD